MVLDILLYSAQDLNSFRFLKTKIRRIMRDQSMLNIYKQILAIAEDPANRKLTSIPLEVISKNIARQNKYIKELENIPIANSKIKNFETYNLAVETELQDIKVEKIKKLQGDMIEAVEMGEMAKANDISKEIKVLLASGVEQLSKEEIIENLKTYYKDIKANKTSTGFKSIDELMDGGFLKGHLLGFSGKSGTGKTWFACNMLMNMIGQSEVVYLSNEMTRNEILTRLLAISTETSEAAIENTQLSADVEEHVGAILELSSVYERCYTLERIEAIVNHELKINNRWVYIIDHFHNLRSPNSRLSDVEAQSRNAHQLQDIAQTYGVTFIIFYQVPKNDYDNRDAMIKGSAAMIEVSNAAFTLFVDEEKQNRSEIEDKKRQKIITISPFKMRRGFKKDILALQDFTRGGLVTEL